MKTYTPLTTLFLLLLGGCSGSVEQTAMEVVVSHIAAAESAQKQQQFKSDESPPAAQGPEAVQDCDFLHDSEDFVGEPPTAIIDPAQDVLARRCIEELASGSSEFAAVSSLLLEYDLATISDADRQKLNELIHQAQLDDEQQRMTQLIQDTFIAVSNSLQAIPPGPLVATDMLCRPLAHVGCSNRLLNVQHELERIAPRRLPKISGEADSCRQSTVASECRPQRLVTGE